MNTDNKDLLIKFSLYGGAAIIIYLLIKKLTNVVGQPLTKAGENMGQAAADLLLPDYNPNSPLYEVQFPDASHHLVDSATVITHFFGDPTFVVPAVDWSMQNGFANVTMKLKQYAPGSYYAEPA